MKKSTGERRNKQKTGPDAYRHPGLSSIRFTTGLFTDQLLHLFIYRLAVVTELLVEDLVGCRITEVIQTVNHTVFTYQSQQCHGQTRRKAVTHHTLWQNGLLIGFGLVAEKSFARHAHDTDRDSLLRKQLGTFDQRSDFGTRSEHHHSRFGGIDYDIGAFRKLGLADNFESYYKTVYNWVNSLVENQTIFSDDIYSDQLLSALNGYYDKLVKWVTDTVIPQAQVAIVAVTGGIWSVVIFLKNILIGMMISVYLLARKESFAKQSKKILYAILPETPYRRTLRAVAEADRIFSGFVRGKLLDSLIIGILCFICCSIFKFPYTPIISVFVGVTNIIPIFGPFLGAIPSAFLILLVSPKQCLYFILFIIALQQFDGNILGPKILGKSTGISSFWVIVAIVVGGGFGGVLGMFLGVPIFACISSLVNWFTNRSLTKKGVTDDAMFAPAPLASPDEKKD